MSKNYLFNQFTVEQQAILIQEMRRPDKEYLLRVLREGRENIEQPEELKGVDCIFDLEEELRDLYDEIIEKVEEMTDEDIHYLFEILPMHSELE